MTDLSDGHPFAGVLARSPVGRPSFLTRRPRPSHGAQLTSVPSGGSKPQSFFTG